MWSFFLERECQIFILSTHSSLCDLNFLFLSKKTHSLFQQAWVQRCTYIKSLLHDIASFICSISHLPSCLTILLFPSAFKSTCMLKVLHQHIIYESLNHQVTSTVEYVVVLFTGPCDEAARNTECEVCLIWIKKKDFCSVYLMSLFYRRSSVYFLSLFYRRSFVYLMSLFYRRSSVYLMSLFYRRSLKSWRPSMTKLTLTEWLWSPQRWNVKSYEHTKW